MKSPLDGTDVYLDCVDRLEPNITHMDNDATIASIAISLKRIADIQDRNVRILEEMLEITKERGIR